MRPSTPSIAAAPLRSSTPRFRARSWSGAVDRQKLGDAVLGRTDRLRALEAIVHPLVREEEEAFLRRVTPLAPLVVLDIPLLFETGGDTRCDAVVVVSAPAAIQAERVLGRAGMTGDKFRAILDKQMPDAEKRRRAHFLVDTSRDFTSAEAQVRSIVTCLAGRPGRLAAWRREES